MPKLEKQLLNQLKPGAKVISFAFKMPNWKPIKTITPFPERKSSSKIRIYKK